MAAMRRAGGAVRGWSAAVAVALLATACGGASDGSRTETAAIDLPATAPCPEPESPGAGAGAQLPDVVLPCLGQSTELGLRALPARPVVLNFWASWCGPCREEMPALQRVAEEAGDQVIFLGVNVKDGRQQARAFLDDFGVDYANLYDETGRSLDLLPSLGLPTTLVLAPDGEIVDKTVGAMTEARLRTLLTDRLGVELPAGTTAPPD